MSRTLILNLGIVNLHLLEYDSDLVLIDAGMMGAKKKVLQAIRQLGHQPYDLKAILVTHADLDHIGSLKAIANATGAPIYAGVESARYIESRQSPPHMIPPLNLMTNTAAYVLRSPTLVNHVVEDGEVLNLGGGIRALATPGHTADHFAYYWEPERILFAGDLFTHLKRLALTPPRMTYSREAAEQSARKVLALNPAAIGVGHGKAWIAEDHPDDLTRLLREIGDQA
ncbi:MAG TPA: MBL fold metallo-hydrolase [Aggregatilineaceae bacterium]|nr:MBL fold metallo-hydrolase [Aggregatilineaceae bacterium]